MEANFNYIDENYKKILYNVGEASAKYRTAGDIVKIMAVTKTVSPDAVNHAIDLGISLLGENRVQEYLSKKILYKKSEVHFIGHLQSNKIKYIIDDVELIHSVDSFKLASEINKCAEKTGKKQKILLEVNIGREPSKSGVMPEELRELVYRSAELENIKVCGLMAIPPAIGSEEFLHEMNKLYIDISEENIDNINMDILSMGMSGDYETAVKHGSNLVRIGSALFGARKYI